MGFMRSKLTEVRNLKNYEKQYKGEHEDETRAIWFSCN